MILPFAVVDPVCVARHGVAAILTAAGHDTVTAEEPWEWVDRPGRRGLLLALRGEREWDWLEQLGAAHAARPGLSSSRCCPSALSRT